MFKTISFVIVCTVAFLMGNSLYSNYGVNTANQPNNDYFSQKFDSQNMWDEEQFYQTFQKSWVPKGGSNDSFLPCLREILKENPDIKCSFRNYGSERNVEITNANTGNNYTLHTDNKIYNEKYIVNKNDQSVYDLPQCCGSLRLFFDIEKFKSKL